MHVGVRGHIGETMIHSPSVLCIGGCIPCHDPDLLVPDWGGKAGCLRNIGMFAGGCQRNGFGQVTLALFLL